MSSNPLHIENVEENVEETDIDLYIANHSPTPRDFFDDALDIEQQYIQEGYRAGCYAALEQSQLQGVDLGFDYGQDMGEELGFYRGFFLSLLLSLYNNAISQNQDNFKNNNNHNYNPPLTTTDYHSPTSLDSIKAYNKAFFITTLLENPTIKSYLTQQLMFSETKYASIITECVSLLSLCQFIGCVPGEDGDVHHITDLRAKSKAIFARLGVSGVFKDQSLIDF